MSTEKELREMLEREENIELVLKRMFWKFTLKEGEVLKCDHCTHEVRGNDLNVVYFEEAPDDSDSDLRVRCETCHEILQSTEESAEVES